MNQIVPNGSMRDDGEGLSDGGGAAIGGDVGRLEGELDGQPEHVEIAEMDDLLVEIGPPVAVDRRGRGRGRRS